MKSVSRAAKALTLLWFGWAINASAENDWIEVKGGSWVPGPVVLIEMKATLMRYTKGEAHTLGRQLKNWKEYTFQYQGQEERGFKHVFVNALCYRDSGWNLEQRLILVTDGGSCFFSLKFDLKTRRYYDLVINGDA